MISRFPLVDLPLVPMAVDASVVINLLGTGIAGTLIGNFGRPMIMAEEAFAEVRRHPIRDADLSAVMGELVSGGLIKPIALSSVARSVFYELTADDLTGGLDDGEAATIALALEHSVSTVVVIDEKKAARKFAERWPGRILTDTVTILAQPATRGSLGAAEFANAFHSALVHARMRVPKEAAQWVIDLIGRDRAGPNQR